MPGDCPMAPIFMKAPPDGAFYNAFKSPCAKWRVHHPGWLNSLVLILAWHRPHMPGQMTPVPTAKQLWLGLTYLPWLQTYGMPTILDWLNNHVLED